MQAIPQEFLAAYQEYDREMTIRKTRLGCVIGIFMVPLFAVLDHFVYEEHRLSFWVVRLVCLILMVSLYQALGTSLGRRFYRVQGVLLLLMPSATVAWMIYATEGAASPYYAGLNLALMVLAVVLDWTFWQSLASVVLVLLLYLLACLFSTPVGHLGIFVNNIFFLVSTGIVIVAGSYFHTQLRIREFVTRHELDKNRVVLEETNQKLRELDQIKSRFFANISHELRTPLTLLLAPLETMLHRFGSSLDNVSREMLSTMHSNGMRLLKLINDLLELVRLESGRMEVKRDRLPLAEFINGLASAARQVADDKRIRLETRVDEKLGTVLADRDKLEKILLNLMFNALKFTPAGGRVEVRAEKQNEELVLSVKDTGVGISEKNLPFVFDRFWQADGSSKRKYHGVGIGLALVKELAEIQRGTVSVESQEGKGATFRVRLPYVQAGAVPERDPVSAEGAESAASAGTENPATVSSEQWLSNLYRRAELFPSVTGSQPAAHPVETSRNGDHPKVLVADDEPDMRRFLCSQLNTHYQVLEAADGQQAVEKAGQFLPDIILLDMMMPEKDGLQACREIREAPATQSIPIIILTARADEETKLAALSAGASDFLAKPFSTTELHIRIKNLIESFFYQRKLSKQNQVLEGTIEQLKETETQLVQTEKLASLGRLSAGIIHEINNPLNFATTGLYTLRGKGKHLAPEQQAEYAEVLKDVEEGIQRVKTIVSDLRSFSHFENDRLDQVDVLEVVTSALRFLSHEWKEQVQIEQKLPEDQAIWANKNKLIQMLINLLQNSVDSLKQKTFAGEKPTIWIEGRVAEGKSVLTIRDNGLGIERAVMDKIFDPFFTTKDVGQGMGLGLSICYRIVQEYEGKISVKSEPGKFCEFNLEFPVKG